MVDEDLVEELATQAGVTAGPALDHEALVGVAQDGGVEGPAAEVVHRDPHGTAVAGGAHVVRGRGRDGLGDHLRCGQPGADRGLAEVLDPGPAPGGGMGEPHLGGRRALVADGLGVHVGQHGRDEVGDGVRLAAEHDGSALADPALRLPQRPGGPGGAQALGRVADEDRPVLVDEHDGRDASLPSELEDLGSVAGAERRRRIAGTEIDAQHPVAHVRTPASVGPVTDTTGRTRRWFQDRPTTHPLASLRAVHRAAARFPVSPIPTDFAPAAPPPSVTARRGKC